MFKKTFWLIIDILTIPFLWFKRLFTQPLSKTVYRLKFFITDPKANIDHWKVYRAKKKNKPSGIYVFVNIKELEHGHPVAHDSYLQKRIDKLQGLNVKKMKQITVVDLDKMIQSDSHMMFYVDKNNRKIILQGNGRFAALKEAGFTGKILLEQRTYKERSIKNYFKKLLEVL